MSNGETVAITSTIMNGKLSHGLLHRHTNIIPLSKQKTSKCAVNVHRQQRSGSEESEETETANGLLNEAKGEGGGTKLVGTVGKDGVDAVALESVVDDDAGTGPDADVGEHADEVAVGEHVAEVEGAVLAVLVGEAVVEGAGGPGEEEKEVEDPAGTAEVDGGEEALVDGTLGDDGDLSVEAVEPEEARQPVGQLDEGGDADEAEHQQVLSEAAPFLLALVEQIEAALPFDGIQTLTLRLHGTLDLWRMRRGKERRGWEEAKREEGEKRQREERKRRVQTSGSLVVASCHFLQTREA